MTPAEYSTAFSVFINLSVASFNVWQIYRNRRERNKEFESHIAALDKYQTDLVSIKSRTDLISARYEKELRLLKENEGLYNVRHDPEQYETYLTLLWGEDE
ncbi:MAG TPA: hypothetical protein VFM18_18880 [Methanosarcina sp.]|nr:hypothetical protein [Methanosarcina sp.]